MNGAEASVNPTLKPAKKPPNHKQAKFLERLEANGGNAQVAKVEAGYSKGTSTTQIMRNIRETSIADVLPQVGVDDLHVAKVIKKGLAAKRTVRTGPESWGQEEDWHARHKFVETFLKIKGVGQKIDVTHTNIDISGDLAEQIVGMYRLMAKSGGYDFNEDAVRDEVMGMMTPVEAESYVEDEDEEAENAPN